MIRLAGNARARLMLIHGYTMVALGLALLYIRATMTNLFFYVIGGALALLLVAASLLFLAGLDWICAAGAARRQATRLRGLLLLSTAIAAFSIFLVLYPGATTQMLSYLIAVYAFALGVGKWGLARSWNGTKREQALMYILACLGLLFSLFLVAVAAEDERASLAVIASYSIFMGLQMLLTMYLMQRTLPIQASSAY